VRAGASGWVTGAGGGSGGDTLALQPAAAAAATCFPAAAATARAATAAVAAPRVFQHRGARFHRLQGRGLPRSRGRQKITLNPKHQTLNQKILQTLRCRARQKMLKTSRRAAFNSRNEGWQTC